MTLLAHRMRPLWIAALVHRLSGLALAVFLPFHFLALGLAISGEARLESFLRWSDQPLVKLSEAAASRRARGSYAGRLAAARTGESGLARGTDAACAAGGRRGDDRRFAVSRERVLTWRSSGSGPTFSFSAAAAPGCSPRCMRMPPIPRSTSSSRPRDCWESAAARAWCRAATTSRCIPATSVERHFMDTIEGGKWLPHQELAWTLVTKAIERITELENEIGCFFDRNPDGTLHGKAFAGQTFDRTVHKGDLTGIEIINRLMEQVWARPGIRRLEEHRAVALIPSQRRRVDRGRAADRHSHRRVPLRRGQGGAARDRRRPDHVSLSHAVRRQEHGRPRHGAAGRPAAARHGDGAVPSDRALRRPRHAHDRHRAGGRSARRRRASAQRRHAAVHGRLRSASGARDPRRGQPRDVCRDARRADHAERRPLHQDGPPRPGQRAQAIQGHGGALRQIAASTSPAAWWKWCRRRTISWVAWCATWTRRRRCPACSWRARTQAACMAPIDSAATASPIRRFLAVSPATRCRNGSRPIRAIARRTKPCWTRKWRARCIRSTRKPAAISTG